MYWLLVFSPGFDHWIHQAPLCFGFRNVQVVGVVTLHQVQQQGFVCIYGVVAIPTVGRIQLNGTGLYI